MFPIGAIVQVGTRGWLDKATRRAYAAPFPDAHYMAGPRAMLRLIPMRPQDPASQANRDAWAALSRFDKPFRTCFATGDPVTRGAETRFRRCIPGAHDARHMRVRRAAHFLQEDQGPALAAFIQQTLQAD